jgi:hypothetical protein
MVLFLSPEALAKVVFVILSAAKDLDSSVAGGSLRTTDIEIFARGSPENSRPGSPPPPNPIPPWEGKFGRPGKSAGLGVWRALKL